MREESALIQLTLLSSTYLHSSKLSLVSEKSNDVKKLHMIGSRYAICSRKYGWWSPSFSYESLYPCGFKLSAKWEFLVPKYVVDMKFFELP